MNYIVLDTETTNTLEEPIMYDIGFAVIDDKGNVLESHSYAIKEVLLDNLLMQSAFYLDKIPSYWLDINIGERELVELSEAKKCLARCCEKYDVKDIYAHNAIFDYRSCTTTQRYITKSAYRYFFPYGINICDTLKYSREAFKKNNHYRHFCKVNNFLTSKGQNKMTAEALYAYLSKDPDFKEEHQGLADVMIEKDILLYCLKHLPDFDARLWQDKERA